MEEKCISPSSRMTKMSARVLAARSSSSAERRLAGLGLEVSKNRGKRRPSKRSSQRH
jgi:hypothetical protein